MDEGAVRRRRLWIAWSLRHTLRPLILASLVRSFGGDPPEIPLAEQRLPKDVSLRPSDIKCLTSIFPGLDEARKIEEDAERLGCEIITPEDDGWPKLFWEVMEDPPPAIYLRGRLHKPASRAVAIVGTRHPSDNGLQLARGLARDLAAEGITIVSGLALGIDGAAHRGALDVSGHTVAVLGGGVDRPSPPSHVRLGTQIAETGALVSEFPIRVDPRPLHFPRRNRIIASLAPVLLVVEGGQRSGARSTVDHALSLGRDVAAVPRDPVHEGSALPNSLIRSGATPITRAEDLLDLLDGDSAGRIDRDITTAPELHRVVQENDPLLGSTEQELLGSLGNSGRTAEEISRTLGRSSDEVLCSLGLLESAGRIRRLPGMRYVRAGAGT